MKRVFILLAVLTTIHLAGCRERQVPEEAGIEEVTALALTSEGVAVMGARALESPLLPHMRLGATDPACTQRWEYGLNALGVPGFTRLFGEYVEPGELLSLPDGSLLLLGSAAPMGLLGPRTNKLHFFSAQVAADGTLGSPHFYPQDKTGSFLSSGSVLPDQSVLLAGTFNALRVASDGEVLWERSFDRRSVYFYDSAVLEDDTIVLAGQASSGQTPGLLLFLNSANGASLRELLLGQVHNTRLLTVSGTVDGGLIAAGGESQGALAQEYGYVAKISSSDEVEWQSLMDDQSPLYLVNDIVESEAGLLFAVGRGAGSAGALSGGAAASWDSEGTLRWVTHLDPAIYPELSRVVISPDGTLLACTTARLEEEGDSRSVMALVELDQDGNLLRTCSFS